MTQWIPCWAKKRTRRRGEPAPNPIPNPCAVLPIPCTARSLMLQRPTGQGAVMCCSGCGAGLPAPSVWLPLTCHLSHL